MVDPAAPFLPPSATAGWAFHPVQHILTLGTDGPASHDVVFHHALSGPPPEQMLEISTFREGRVTLNGEELPAQRGSQHWKQSQKFDLRPGWRAGENHLAIAIHNDDGIPALLVEDPAGLRTPGAWQAALAHEPDDRVQVVGPLHRLPKPGPFQEPAIWTWGLPVTVAGLIIVPSVSALAVWGQIRPGRALIRGRFLTTSAHAAKGPMALRRRGQAFTAWLAAAACVVAFALQLWNATHFPYDRAEFDWLGHAEYVHRLAANPLPPLANEGWQMFQPPLYYYLAAAVLSVAGQLNAVQVIGALAGSALAVLAWLYVHRFEPALPGGSVAAVCFAGFLPMVLYMGPLISNETFAAALAAAALYFVTSRPGLAGVLCGLALLSKFTALFVALAGAMTLGLRALRGRRLVHGRQAAVFVTAVAVIAGWFYLRNVTVFGSPVIGNWDDQTGLHYRQNPSYRTVEYYASFGQVFFQHPEQSLWTSWWDGLYATMWADAHTNFFDEEHRYAYLLQQLTLLLATAPTAAIIAGFALTVGGAARRAPGNPDFLLVAVSALIWIALIWFSIKVPAYSTVKAFFFLTLIPVMAVFLVRGRRAWWRIPGAGPLLDGSLGAVTGLAFVVYRFP